MRRSPTLLVVLAAVLSLSACTTLTDSDAAARVGDTTLTQSQFDELLVGASAGTSPDERVTVPISTAHNLLNTWLITQILSDDIDRLGGSVDDTDIAEATRSFEQQFGPDWADTVTPMLAELQVTQQAVIEVWSNIDVPTPNEDEFRAIYARGPSDSGIACTAHILVETEAEAQAIVDELDDGADFAELAAQRSTDPGSAADGGVLPCAPTSSFAQTYTPEFVDAALEATIGEPTDPVASPFGYHVIVVRPFDEVRDEGIEEIYADTGVRFRQASRAADVHVDPRFGYFDPDAGVLPLG